MANGTAIRDPKIRRARALRMIEQRILGLSLTQVGKLFNLEGKTVMRELTWAEKQGLLEDLERKILNELVPSAITTIKHVMETNKDSAVALEVMKGVGLFRKPAERPALLPAASADEESLEFHVKRVTRSASAQEIETSGTPSPNGRSLSEGATLSLPPIEAEVVETGSETRPSNAYGSVEQSNLSGATGLE